MTSKKKVADKKFQDAMQAVHAAGEDRVKRRHAGTDCRANWSGGCSMTDITELAQSLKSTAEKATQGNWRAFKYHDGRCGIGGGHHDEIMVCEHISKRRPHDAEFIAMANPANVIALVEALEKAQTINAAAEKLVRCKGRYHSEQNYRALAALFGVKTPDLPPLEHENVHYADAAEMEIAALRQRIAELESRTVKLPEPSSWLNHRAD